jgi:hypothetical protein
MLSAVMLNIVMLSVLILNFVILSVVMLSVMILSVIILSVIMLSVVMLSLITLSVMMLSVTASGISVVLFATINELLFCNYCCLCGDHPWSFFVTNDIFTKLFTTCFRERGDLVTKVQFKNVVIIHMIRPYCGLYYKMIIKSDVCTLNVL